MRLLVTRSKFSDSSLTATTLDKGINQMSLIRSLAIVALFFCSTMGVSAYPIFIKTPSVDAKLYRPITIDPKKLKIPLITALAQFSGEEFILANDVNAPIIGPNFMFTNAFSYPINAGFPKLVKIDGIKDKVFANFKVPVIGGPIESARVATVSFTKPTTEFGMKVLPGRSDLALISAFDVTVNGIKLGRIKLPPYVVSYIGFRDLNGLNTIVFKPVGWDINGYGAWVGREVYTK
jgi:hypothetical protein